MRSVSGSFVILDAVHEGGRGECVGDSQEGLRQLRVDESFNLDGTG